MSVELFFSAPTRRPTDRLFFRQGFVDEDDGRDHDPLATQHPDHGGTRDEWADMAQLRVRDLTRHRSETDLGGDRCGRGGLGGYGRVAGMGQKGGHRAQLEGRR